MRVIQALLYPRGIIFVSFFLPRGSSPGPSGTDLTSLADRYGVSSYRTAANRFSKQKRPSWETGDLCLGVSSRFVCKSRFLFDKFRIGGFTQFRWWNLVDGSMEILEGVLLSLQRHVRSGESGICWPLAPLGVVWSADLEIGWLDFVDWRSTIETWIFQRWDECLLMLCRGWIVLFVTFFFFFFSWERVNNSWALSWKSYVTIVTIVLFSWCCCFKETGDSIFFQKYRSGNEAKRNNGYKWSGSSNSNRGNNK